MYLIRLRVYFKVQAHLRTNVEDAHLFGADDLSHRIELRSVIIAIKLAKLQVPATEGRHHSLAHRKPYFTQLTCSWRYHVQIGHEARSNRHHPRLRQDVEVVTCL